MTPTLILFNGNIYTQWEATPHATAIAMRNGRILAVGDDASMRALAGAQTQEIDLQGRFTMPGLTDAHTHFYSWAITRRELDLLGVPSFEEMATQIRERATQAPIGTWLVGRGWNETEWEPAIMPSADDLDAISTQHPMIFWRSDMHGAVANRAALAAAGITRDTPDPDGGVIERDADGEPTGRLFEMAIRLVSHAIPERNAEQHDEDVRSAIRECHRMGLTGVHDQRSKGNYEGAPALQAYGRLRNAGQLKLRITTNIDAVVREHAFASGLYSGFGDELLQLGHIKIFVDGSLGSQTAWMLEPFEGTTDNYGVVVTPVEEIHTIVREGQQHGWAISVHAIGDRANREILDIFEELAPERPAHLHIPHRIEHVQTIHPDDLPRLAQLGITASVQPVHCTDDYISVERLWGKRGDNAYPFRQLLDSGATLAFGSDCPTAAASPFIGLHSAVTRQRPDSTPPGGWHTDECLTIEEAIAAYTIAPAQAVGRADSVGRLAPGYLADLIVLDRNLLTIAPSEIVSSQVEMVVFDGEVQWLG